MEYTEEYLQHCVTRLGEVFVVLESGEEYKIHGTDGYEIDDSHPDTGKIVRAEGMMGDEYAIVEFPLDAIEHHHTHREL